MSYGTIGKILGVDVTEVRTATQGANNELGLVIQGNAGSAFLYVQADDAITLYDAVTYDVAAAGSGSAANAPWLVTPAATAGDTLVGVAGVAIAAGGYGFVQVKGKAFVQAETSVAALDKLTASSVSGELITQPSTATNPSKVDFDDALGQVHGIGAVALEAEAGTTAGFAFVVLC